MLTPQFDLSPYTITNVKGTMITASRTDHCITRNTSYFKLFTRQTASQTEASDDKIVKQNARTEKGARNEIIENQDESRQRYPRRERTRPEFYHDEQRQVQYSNSIHFYLKDIILLC